MRLLIFLAVVSLSRARIVPKCPDTVEIHGIKHEKQVLKADLDGPYQLAIDYDTNVLFFSYSTTFDVNDSFKSAYINLKTNEFGIIKKIRGGFANAVDGKHHVVYLGGNDGIYTFDYTTKNAISIGARDTSIWQLFYKDKLYYSDYPAETAYYFENGVSKEVPELKGTKAMLLALDKNDNIFFSNSSGLFCYKQEKSKIFEIGQYTVNGFTTNLDNDLFFSTPEGIYSIDETQNVKQVAEIENVYGLAIAGDNDIIYSNSDSIVRLTPTKRECSPRNHNTV